MIPFMGHHSRTQRTGRHFFFLTWQLNASILCVWSDCFLAQVIYNMSWCSHTILLLLGILPSAGYSLEFSSLVRSTRVVCKNGNETVIHPAFVLKIPPLAPCNSGNGGTHDYWLGNTTVDTNVIILLVPWRYVDIFGPSYWVFPILVLPDFGVDGAAPKFSTWSCIPLALRSTLIQSPISRYHLTLFLVVHYYECSPVMPVHFVTPFLAGRISTFSILPSRKIDLLCVLGTFLMIDKSNQLPIPRVADCTESPWAVFENASRDWF